MKLFVFHTPEQTPTDTRPDCAIAIDVLRATTTVATALEAGAEAVQAFSSIEQLMQASEAWPVEKRLRAGERGGAKVQGCDLGNSPLDCTVDRVIGRRLFLSTTNGTRCLERIQSAQTVLTAALVNRATVSRYLHRHQPETVWLVGSGWEGSYSLEDTVCAGAVLHHLRQLMNTEHVITGNDEAIASLALYEQWQSRLLDLLSAASHGHRLLRLDGMEDLKYCAQLDTLDVLPIQTEPGLLVKQV
ncbi:MAG: 2-phosphosulfolactate phosphatase family protein [Leptolyngbya sp. DLM2.Bin15]|nr:MAG: 2-phosphosulfolactate phosphatase family protein [Leptolyngbya sp. DLM2.Bin15]